MGLCTVGLDVRGDETLLAVRTDGREAVTTFPGVGRSDLLERVGDTVPLRVRGGPTGPAEEVLVGLVREAVRRTSVDDGTPDAVGLAVPVAWSEGRIKVVTERLAREVPRPVLVRRPRAAAAASATDQACVAVLLLGEDAVEAAVVGVDAPRCGGLTVDGFAGRDLEDALLEHVGDAATGVADGPGTRAAARQALRALASHRTAVLDLAGATVRVHLADLEERVGPVASQVLRRALGVLDESSGGKPPEAVLLAGDGADLPFLVAAVAGTSSRPVLVDAGHGIVARGAAQLAAAAAATPAVRS